MSYTDQVIAGSYEIRLNGTALSGDLVRPIEEISVEDELNTPTMFRITFNISDFDSGDWKGIDLETFKLGDEVKILMGVDQHVEMITGEIAVLEPQFGASCYMEIRGFDRMQRLRFGSYRRSFAEMTDSDIVSSVVADAGLSAQADTTSTTHPYVFQNGSNYDFLLGRAKDLGFEMIVDDKTFMFRQSQESSSPAATLEYGTNLERILVRMAALTEGSEVEVRGWDMQNKAEVTASAASGSELSLMKGSKSGFDLSEEAFGPSKVSLVDGAVVDATHAETVAKANYNVRLKQFLRVEGTCSGNPDIRAGKTVEIDGIGEKFKGVYYVVASTHSMNGPQGYITTFKARRTAV